MPSKLWAGVVASVIASQLVVAQGLPPFVPAAARTFEVASVKDSTSLDIDGFFNQTGGRFTVTNLELRAILRYAYRVKDYQLIDVPGWASSARYHIEATFADASASTDEVRAMLQALLKERFGLRVHGERRDLPMYALVLVREDGRPGPQLMRVDIDCAVARCNAFVTTSSFRATGTLLSGFVQQLEQILHEPIVDRTGLTGRFNIDVRWSTAGARGVDPGDATVEQRAAIFTALPEQLGLRLQPIRGPVDVMVIDLLTRPTPN